MKITNLSVDAFGVWSRLALEEVPGDILLVYGPNEAGKTTLLQFVRAMLYGFSPERRARYLPPVQGGRAGGKLGLTSPHGAYQLRRMDDGDERSAGQVTITSREGAPQPNHILAVLLAGVDESIFSNVFAVGLREMQELGALSDTGAADLLYKLSTGLDRVSLVQVSRELAAARHRLLGQDGKPAQIDQLVKERDVLMREIDELRAAGRQFTRLAEQRDQVQLDITSQQDLAAELERNARRLEAAIAVRKPWNARHEATEELEAIGDLATLPEGGLAELDELGRNLDRRRSQIKQLDRERKQLRSQAAKLQINTTLWRHAPRIQALLEQQNWLTTLETQTKDLEGQVRTVEGQLAAEHKRFGVAETGVKFPGDARGWDALKSAARAIRDTKRQHQEARQQVDVAEQTAHKIATQIRSSLEGRSEGDLPQAVERAGELVTQLRRRVQLDERLSQMSRHDEEVQGQVVELLEQQMLPQNVLITLGVIFVVGAMMLLGGLFLPESVVGSAGWAFALLGIVAMAGAGTAKVVIEKTSAQRLEETQKQADLLAKQIDEAKQERDELDTRLPRGGGPLLTRLQNAERELASLEELLSSDAERQASQVEAEGAAARAEQVGDDLGVAQRRWEQALAAAHLPKTLSPKQVMELAERRGHIEEFQQRLDRLQPELAQRRKELTALVERITQVFTEVQLTSASLAPRDRLKQLGTDLAEQEKLVAQRTELLVSYRKLGAQRAKLAHAAKQWARKRRKFLRSAGVKDEAEFRHLAAQHDRSQQLKITIEQLSREIAAALGHHATEEEVDALFTANDAGELEPRWERETLEHQAAEERLKKLYEQRGELIAELKGLVEDRRLGERTLALSAVEARLKEAIERWQVLAVAQSVLESVRKVYEAERQPETLQEASLYLATMTAGQYVRVWTPLDHEVLFVDTHQGKSLPVELLSRGTREQLFLSLRLALAASFARRGAMLPVVLDDVLVNFDGKRARAAVEVLKTFASMGHQVLVFTCHEHVVQLFSSMGIATRTLPPNGVAITTPAVQTPPPLKKVAPPPPQVEMPPVEKAPIETPPIETLMLAPEPVVEVPTRSEYDVADAPEPLAHEVVPLGWNGIEPEPEETVPEETLPEEERTEPEVTYELPDDTPPQPLPTSRKAATRYSSHPSPFAATAWHEPIDDEPSLAALRAAQNNDRLDEFDHDPLGIHEGRLPEIYTWRGVMIDGCNRQQNGQSNGESAHTPATSGQGDSHAA